MGVCVCECGGGEYCAELFLSIGHNQARVKNTVGLDFVLPELDLGHHVIKLQRCAERVRRGVPKLVELQVQHPEPEDGDQAQAKSTRRESPESTTTVSDQYRMGMRQTSTTFGQFVTLF